MDPVNKALIKAAAALMCSIVLALVGLWDTNWLARAWVGLAACVLATIILICVDDESRRKR